MMIMVLLYFEVCILTEECYQDNICVYIHIITYWQSWPAKPVCPLVGKLDTNGLMP